MLANVRVQLQALNHVQFSDGEWRCFVETFLDKPSDSIIDKTRKIRGLYRKVKFFKLKRVRHVVTLE